eukprot:5520859-Pyramimonas_sp.AAC.1
MVQAVQTGKTQGKLYQTPRGELQAAGRDGGAGRGTGPRRVCVSALARFVALPRGAMLWSAWQPRPP